MDDQETKRVHRNAFVNRKRQSMGSVGPFRLLVNNRYRLFEFHGVCGPILLDANEEPLARQPAPSSDFWPAFTAWQNSGCHVDQHGRAYVPSARIMAHLATNKGEAK